MPVLLTVLSVLVVWAFLTVLVLGLLLIFKGLQGTGSSLEKVTMGVRAIERQTDPLESHAEEVAGGLDDLATGLEEVTRRLDRVTPKLQREASRLRRHA